MIHYCIHNTNGQIFRTGSCLPDQLFAQFIEENNKLKITDVPVGWDTHFISNGILQELPAKPDNFYIFNYTTKQWEIDFSKLIFTIKRNRNSLLLSSDWTQLPNNPLTLEVQTLWATYRQQIRDITLQPSYPTNVLWPTPPES